MGMARVAFNEHPNLIWRMIDLPEVAGAKDVAAVLAEIQVHDREHEVAYRDGKRYVHRVARIRATELPRRLQDAVQPDGTVLPFQLQIETPGILSNLSLNLTARREPGPDDVEAKVVVLG